MVFKVALHFLKDRYVSMTYIEKEFEPMRVAVLKWLCLEETDADVLGDKLRVEGKVDCS